jgi:hypothetical protein
MRISMFGMMALSFFTQYMIVEQGGPPLHIVLGAPGRSCDDVCGQAIPPPVSFLDNAAAGGIGGSGKLECHQASLEWINTCANLIHYGGNGEVLSRYSHWASEALNYSLAMTGGTNGLLAGGCASGCKLVDAVYACVNTKKCAIHANKPTPQRSVPLAEMFPYQNLRRPRLPSEESRT